jgi:hypothetical protein
MLRSQRPLTVEELADVLLPLGEVTAASELSGGTFSSVQRVEFADGSLAVAKTSVPDNPEHGALLAYEHDLARVEADMLSLLAAVPGIPTAPLLLEDFSRSRVEVDVVVSGFLDGTPWDRAPGMLPDAVAQAGREVGSIFARLHELRGPRFGYPAAGFALGGGTWAEAFNAILRGHVADAEAYGVEVRGADVLAVLERGRSALEEVTEPCLVHNDLWEGNVLLDPASGRVLGIVDLERALYGDPLLDFVGMNPFNTGELAPNHVAGYLATGGTLPLDPGAGTATGLTRAADQRVALYRLSLLTVMTVEVVPRGFYGEWVAPHVERTTATRDAVLAYADATFPAA